MPIFAVEKIAGLPPFQVDPFYKLLVDGKCQLDEFWLEMERSGNQIKNLEKLHSIMVELCLGKRVPPNWFTELKNRGKGDPYPDFEIRCQQLRLYLFEDVETGKIVVLGELKKGQKTQKKSIDKMRKIKRAYFSSKTNPDF